MIDEIKGTTVEFEFNDKTFTVEPIGYSEQLRLEEQSSDEREMSRLTMEHHLKEMDGTDYTDDDDIDDVSMGFLAKLNEAIEEANGLEGFTDDQLRQTHQNSL